MLAYEKNFIESNFHNVNLATAGDFPKAIALIYQDYKNSTDFSYDKPRAWIQTSASKSNSRISHTLKSKLTSLQSEGGQEMDSRLSHRKSHAKFSNTRLQTFPSETAGILKTESDNNYYNSIDEGNNYYHQNHAKTSLRQDHLTPQRGQKFTDESMHAHMDNSYNKNSQLSNNKYPDQSSPNINVFKPQAEDQKNEISPLHNYRHKGRDPFLQRLSEYKGIYDSFKYKYETKVPQKTEPEHAKLENSRINNERIPAPERITRNEVIIQEETPPPVVYNNNPVKNAPTQRPPQNEIIMTQEDDTLSSIGLRNPPKNLKNIQNPTPVIQQDTPPAQYQKPVRNAAPVIQQDTPPSGGLRQSQKAPPAARKVPQQQDTPPSKGLRLSQHSIRNEGLNLEKETPPHSNHKVPKYPTQNEISPISAAVENKYNRTQKNNQYYQHQPYQQTQQTPSDQESLMNLKASLDEQDAQRTIKKGQNNHQKLRERPGKSQEVVRKVNQATQMTPYDDEEEEESYHDKGIQAEIPLPKKNAFTIKKRQGSITDMHRRSGGSDYELPESHHMSPPKVLKRGGIKNNYTPRREEEEERAHQEPFYRHERREKSTKKLVTPRSISQDSSMYHHQYDQRKRPDPLEGRVPLRNPKIAARKKQHEVEEDPRYNEPEEEESQQEEEEEEEVTREVPRKKKLAAVRVSRKEHPSLKKIKEISPLRVDGRTLEQREDRLPTILREKLYKNDASLRSLLSNQHEDYYDDAGSKRTLPVQNRHRNHHERALHDSAMDLTNNDEESIILKTEHHNYNHRSRSAARQKKQKLSPIRSNPMGEDSYRNFTHNIATLITNYSNPLGDCEPEVLVGRFIEEIKSHHPILSKFSYRALKEIIQGCNILNLKNTEIYREKEHNEYSYIILYGEVFLKNKTFGVFKHCQIGECVGEEALIDGNYTKQETAQVIDAAALIEINQNFIDYFREAIGTGYRGDYTLLLGMLRKSLNQKKATKQRMITGKK